MRKINLYNLLTISALAILTSATTCNQTNSEPGNSLCQTSLQSNFIEQSKVVDYLSEFPTHTFHENDLHDQAYETIIAISAFGEDLSENLPVDNDIEYLMSTSMVANDDLVLAVNIRLYNVSGYGCAVDDKSLDEMLVKEVEIPIIDQVEDLNLIEQIVKEQFIENPNFDLGSTKVCNSYVWDGPEVNVADTPFSYRIHKAKSILGDAVSLPFKAVGWIVLTAGYIGQ